VIAFLRYIKLAKQKPAIIKRGVKAMFMANLLKKPVLRGADIAVTYKCQAHCKKCSTKALIDSSRQEMTLAQITGISREIIGLGGILINLTGGEPLLREDILDIVESLQRMPALVSLSSNGLPLNEKILKSLRKAGLNVIQIGLSSPIAEEHDQELGVPGGFNQAIYSIKEAKRLGIEVLINAVITQKVLYSKRMEGLAQIAKENNSFLSLIFPAQVGGWQGEKVELEQKDYDLLKRKWFKYNFITNDTKTCYRKKKCPAGTEKIYISPYGDLYPCPFIHYKKGNILESGLQSLWQHMHKDVFKGCVNIQ